MSQLNTPDVRHDVETLYVDQILNRSEETVATPDTLKDVTGGAAKAGIKHCATAATAQVTDPIISIEAAVTVTMHTSPVEGETHLAKRKLTTGTPIVASGTAGDFWYRGSTVDTYSLGADGDQVAFYWDGTHWVVTGKDDTVT